MACGAGLNLSLVLWTWTYNEAGLAARCATDLILPVGLLWTTALVAAVANLSLGHRWIAALFFSGFVFISLLGNGPIADWSSRGVEMERTDLTPFSEPFSTVVVLGGSVVITYDGVPELSCAGQRIMTTAQLWHAGRTQSIICTGSSPISPLIPSQAGRILLESVSVPGDKIYESPGDNTSQEMQNLKKFFASPPAGFPTEGKKALVTSAFHMKRAMRLAADNDLAFIPIPCGYEASIQHDFTPRQFVPNADAMSQLGRAIKERLARWVSR